MKDLQPHQPTDHSRFLYMPKLTPEIVASAQATVAQYARDAADEARLLKTLAIERKPS